MKREFFHRLPLILAVGILCGCIGFFSGRRMPEWENPAPAEESHTVQQTKKEESSGEAKEEMLGVWVPYLSLDMSGTDRSERAWRNKVTEIMENIRQKGANTVIFHVRPFCDSLYPSEYFPMSHILTGEQGKAVSYDPLAIAVQTAHEKGLKFHAWINPLRVRLKTVPEKLADNNPYQQWQIGAQKRYTFSADGGIFLNPAYPEVRKRIIDGAREIVRQYEVDGLQIDDYFYPEGNDYDETEYLSYKKQAGENALTKAQWRCENINMLVCGLYDAVHERKGCVFGISPQCNTDNDLKAGADVFRWCSSSGYADYLCPQLYVSMEHPTAPFGKLAEKWRSMTSCPSVRLYFGLSLYKVGTDADSGTWLGQDHMIEEEMTLGRQKGADGFMLYSISELDNTAVIQKGG